MQLVYLIIFAEWTNPCLCHFQSRKKAIGGDQSLSLKGVHIYKFTLKGFQKYENKMFPSRVTACRNFDKNLVKIIKELEKIEQNWLFCVHSCQYLPSCLVICHWIGLDLALLHGWCPWRGGFPIHILSQSVLFDDKGCRLRFLLCIGRVALSHHSSDRFQ